MSTNNRHQTILSGKGLMQTIEAYNQGEQWDLAYHGSQQPHAVLRAAPAFWRRNGVRYDDGGAAICADVSPLVPVFMALAPRYHSYGYRPNADGGVDFYIDYAGRLGFEGSVGYVAVLAASDFKAVELSVPDGLPAEEQFGRLPELRRKDPLEPSYYVEVDYDDFLPLLNDSPASSFEYRDA